MPCHKRNSNIARLTVGAKRRRALSGIFIFDSNIAPQRKLLTTTADEVFQSFVGISAWNGFVSIFIIEDNEKMR